VVFGAIYYQEFADYDAGLWVLFSIGLAIAMMGLGFLIRSHHNKDLEVRQPLL